MSRIGLLFASCDERYGEIVRLGYWVDADFLCIDTVTLRRVHVLF